MSEFPPVQELVPQRPPMLLLDAVTAWDGVSLECVTTVRADWLLVEAGRMPAAGLLEVMAQAVAAMHGLQGHARGEPVRVGLLTGCRELRLHAPAVPVGTSLRVRARQVVDLEAAAEFACSVVTAEGRALAEGALQVVRGEPAAAGVATAAGSAGSAGSAASAASAASWTAPGGPEEAQST